MLFKVPQIAFKELRDLTDDAVTGISPHFWISWPFTIFAMILKT